MGRGRESEGAMTHRASERERERHGEKQLEVEKKEEGHQKMERLRGVMVRGRPPEGSVYMKHCGVCLSKSVYQCVWWPVP